MSERRDIANRALFVMRLNQRSLVAPEGQSVGFRGTAERGTGEAPMRTKYCLKRGIRKNYSCLMALGCGGLTWRFVGACLLFLTVVPISRAEPILKIDTTETAVGGQVTVRAEGATPGSGIKWRWNDKVKAERLRWDHVVLRALLPGEAVVNASDASGDAEVSFTIRPVGDGAPSAARAQDEPQMKPAEHKTPPPQPSPEPPKPSEATKAPTPAPTPGSPPVPKAMTSADGKGEQEAMGEMVIEKHPDGSRSAEGRMKDGRREGTWTFWSPGGKKTGEGEYRAGKKHGAWQQWDDKENLVVESVYEDDREIRHTDTLWDDKGRKARAETIARAGDSENKEVIEWGWHDNGKMMGEKRTLNGMRHGEWKLWDEAGGSVMSVTFTNGWALPSPEDIKGSAERKADEIYRGVIALETNDFSRAAALATGLIHDEQEALSAMAFRALKVTDDDETAKFERLYRLVIDACPETDRAHEAHWRLTHMYQQAFDPPQHEKIVALLEGFLARYKESKVVSMEKYPAEALVFSPVRSLHQSYEALKHWDKIAAYYGRLATESKPLKPVDQFEYAKALDETGNKAGAIDWYQKYLNAETDRQSFMLEVAGDRVKELKGQ